MSQNVHPEVLKLAKSLEGGGGTDGMNGTIAPNDVERIVKFMNINEKDVVLDVGSACGNACVNIAESGGCRVVGIESNDLLHNNAMLVRRDMLWNLGKAPAIIPVLGDFRHRGVELCQYVTCMYAYWEANNHLWDWVGDEKEKDGMPGFGTVQTFFMCPNVRLVALVGFKNTNDPAIDTLKLLIQQERNCTKEEAHNHMKKHFTCRYIKYKDTDRDVKNKEALAGFKVFGAQVYYKCLVIERKKPTPPKPIGDLAGKECRKYEGKGKDIKQVSKQKHIRFMLEGKKRPSSKVNGPSTSTNTRSEEPESPKHAEYDDDQLPSTSSSTATAESQNVHEDELVWYRPRYKDKAEMRANKTNEAAGVYEELDFGKIMSHLKSVSSGRHPEGHIQRANALIDELAQKIQ